MIKMETTLFISMSLSHYASIRHIFKTLTLKNILTQTN